MATRRRNGLDRREFLKVAGAAAVAAIPLRPARANAPAAQAAARPLVIIWRQSDPIAQSPTTAWAHAQLAAAFRAKGFAVAEKGDPAAAALAVFIAGPKDVPLLGANDQPAPVGPESLLLQAWAPSGKPPAILAVARDVRGLMYAVLELADRVSTAPDLAGAMVALMPLAKGQEMVLEKPANRVRGIFRMFVSELEDKPWFYDKEFWPRYLTMLATNRFNRFNLSLGLGYDFSQNLRDVYFFFAYPFLVQVPGFNVRAVGRDRKELPAEERDRNLAMLRYISEQAALRGLDFHLGLWTHNYVWTNSPNASHTIEGLTPDTQAPYCKEALHRVLDACPGITGVTLRTHGESGVPEGRYDIWKTIMSGITGLQNADGAPRTIELDMHGKSMTQEMIDTALTTRMPVTVSPKFWAEHMGLPYMQASIRQSEMPRAQNGTGLMALSGGTRSFLRYSFGDLIQKDRKHKIVTRVWPGTQRLLLWGDPLYAAEYGRTFNFAGTDGVDFFEPLSFKGRMGSGVAPAVAGAGRTGYADAALVPAGGDWEKYLYTYRLLGRLTYKPACDAEVWRRLLRAEHGAMADGAERALAAASRILPMITSSHDPSASNQQYWPEISTNQSIVNGQAGGPFGETPAPRTFDVVSALDPQMFLSVNKTAEALLAGESPAAISMLEVAAVIEKWSTTAMEAVHPAETARVAKTPAFRRAEIDVTIAAAMGQFFAYKVRAAVLFAMYERNRSPSALSEAVALYQKARDAWAGMMPAAKAYAADLSYGFDAHQRGHWSDRIGAMDKDIAAMKALTPGGAVQADVTAKAIAAVLKETTAPRATELNHEPPKMFTPGEPLVVKFGAKDKPKVRVLYRHVNQGEVWQVAEVQENRATIPAAYTKSPFALQYYFEVQTADGRAGMYPGFGAEFTGQPYFVVAQ